jgi:hypothetical protein
METVGRMCDLLDRWRHLPDYQLERRADLFFALYLPEFLAGRFGVELDPRFVPEFPLRIGTIYPEVGGNQSCKVDYLAVTRNLAGAFLIELKTDSASRRDGQDDYLSAAVRVGLRGLVDGVVEVARASLSKHKYCCLLRLLEELSLVRLPGELHAALGAARFRSAVNGCLARVEVVAPEATKLRVVYVQPVARGEGEVGFGELADWLDGKGERAGCRFAASLRRWAGVRAGWG